MIEKALNPKIIRNDRFHREGFKRLISAIIGRLKNFAFS
jgi:hypothetical protein